MKTKLLGAAVLIVIAGLGILSWVGYQLFTTGFSAKTEPHALEIWMARQIRHLAIPIDKRNLTNPVPLTAEVRREGRAHFADHCAVCHANDGSGQTPIGKNVYPKAPDLRLRETQSMSDGELFWVIHNGIRFTAMPAWGAGEPEKDLDSWKLVHFMRHLPQLTQEELDEMKTLNPKTPNELLEEAAFERFLEGADAGGKSLEGHHH
ncbi:MAG TPA: cytochrome c [Nitrospira sp.]|nr:cytochrome c [Nitrospira sp.]